MTPLRIATLLILSCNCFSEAAEKPNFLILFADDAGYADFGFQPECPPEMATVTPRLTRFASEGIRFTNGYVSGCVCSPSRAGMMTGRYQQRFGHEMNVPPGYMQGGLPLSEKFVGNHLATAGYTSGLIGKWHLGYPDEYQPNRRGFDHFYGFLQGARSYYTYGPKLPPHQVFQLNGKPLPEAGYSTDRIGAAACDFLDANHEQPFFLFVSFNAVHGPMQARKQDLEKLAHVPDAKHRHYVGMMQALDENVAKILAKLEDLKLADDTLVIFTNDNGGQTQNTANNAPLRGRKGQLWEGGTRVPMVMRWPGVIKPKSVSDEPVISLDFLTTFLAASKTKPIAKLDGVNLMPLLSGQEKKLPPRSLYWRSKGSDGPISIRRGNWKLIHNRNESGAQVELYNLREDIGETNDLAAKHSEQAKELSADLARWERELVEPLWGGRGKTPKKDAQKDNRRKKAA